MPNGTVILIGKKNASVIAVRIDDGEYTVADLLGSWVPELGERVSGALDGVGTTELRRGNG
jgi:hypothetical protein